MAVATNVASCLSGGGTESTNSADPVPPGTGGNNPPSISGSAPASIVVGSSYSFLPTAQDPDGDELTFSIENLPLWASFDAGSGLLSGTPGPGTERAYTDIVISVSDGQSSASMSPFTIDVVSGGQFAVTISWTPPTTNEDGSTLTDLAGYKIYYGFNAGSYPNSIEVNNASTSSYVVENLVAGTYFFALTSLNSNRIESALSDPISVSVN